MLKRSLGLQCGEWILGDKSCGKATGKETADRSRQGMLETGSRKAWEGVFRHPGK